MRLTPQGNRLLVHVDEPKVTKLEVLLPDAKTTYGMPIKGTVKEVGTGGQCVLMDYRKGDIVFFSRYAGQALKLSSKTFSELGDEYIEGEKYLILNTKDIYCRQTEGTHETQTTEPAS